MIEIIFLVVVLAAFRETAVRRGVRAWYFILAALVGYVLIGNVAAMVLGVGPHYFFAWGWIGLVYVSIYLIGGGGRRLKETWQCPECRLFNAPSTIVCPCGHKPLPEA